MGLKQPGLHPGLAGPRPRPRRTEQVVPFEGRPPSWLTATASSRKDKGDRGAQPADALTLGFSEPRD